MSALQQIMRRQVRPPSAQTIQHAWGWFLEGLGVILPQKVKQFGWRAKSLLIELGATDENERRSTVERTFFGEMRLTAGEQTASIPINLARPAEIVLPVENYFVMRLSLPSEAAQTLHKTVRLRLDEISPIPPEDAAFAIGKSKRSKDGRLNVEIAITKKKTLAAIRELFSNVDIGAIGARPDPNGRLRFTFVRDASSGSNAAKPFINAALLIAALILFSISIDIHLSRRLKYLEQHEAAILSELRAIRPAAALFEDVGADSLLRARGESTASFFSTIQEALAALPEGARVERINVDRNQIDVRGFAPTIAISNSAQSQVIARTPSPHPGYDQFQYQVERSGAP